jgi:Holliday junction resolvasome RuvABC endonuclease subunit
MKVFTDGMLVSELPVYIGIDQSYSGFAITALNDTGYKTTVYKSDKRGVDRLKDIQAYVMNVLTEYRITDVAMEGYAFGSQMSNMLGELGGMVKMTLHDFGVYPLIVPPTNLKKYVAGKGQGVSKSQILLYAYKKWGVEFTDDNAADSYALAHLVSGAYSLAYEKEVYDKLQDVKFREQ